MKIGIENRSSYSKDRYQKGSAEFFLFTAYAQT